MKKRGLKRPVIFAEAVGNEDILKRQSVVKEMKHEVIIIETDGVRPIKISIREP